MNTSTEIMAKGMDCLIRELGYVEAEIFISTVNHEQLDYTEWRKNLFEGMTLEELNAAAADYDRKHPFVGKKAKRI